MSFAFFSAAPMTRRASASVTVDMALSSRNERLCCRGLLYGVRRLADDVKYKPWVGQHRHVAAVDLMSVGAHSFRDESLQRGLERSVLSRHDVPARLRFPGSARSLLRKQVRSGRALCRPDNALLLFR